MPHKDIEKRRAYHRQYRIDNKERIAGYQVVYAAKDVEAYREKANARCVRHRSKNPEAVNQNARERRLKNPQAQKDADVRYAKAHPDRMLAKSRRRYATRDPVEWNASKKQYYHARPSARIAQNLRSRMRIALNRAGADKSQKTVVYLGCSIQELMAHLEANFQSGMTWENRSEWHIDHVVPCAAFDLTDPEQQGRCFHYSNLMPLWAADNLRKGARI